MKKQLIGFIMPFLICMLMLLGTTAQSQEIIFGGESKGPDWSIDGDPSDDGSPPPDPDPVVPESDNTPPPGGTSGGKEGEEDPNGQNEQNGQNGEGGSNTLPPLPKPNPVVRQSDNTPPPGGTSGGGDSRDSNGGQQQQFAPEDVNRDGDVDSDDLLAVAMNFGKTPTGDLARYDFDGNGDIDSDDFLLVIQAMGGQSGNPGAPAASHTLSDTLEHIKGLNITDPEFQRVIQLLEKRAAELNPKKTTLLANYPNPFNPETWIPYRLAKAADVTLTIYAVSGQPVRSLALGHRSVGSYLDRARAAYWDGKNAFGESVASGLYFYTLTADDFSATRKMLVAK